MAAKRSWTVFRDCNHDDDDCEGIDDALKAATPPLLFQSLDSYCDVPSLELNPLMDLRLSGGTSALAAASLDSHYSHVSTQYSFGDADQDVTQFTGDFGLSAGQSGTSGPAETFLLAAPVWWMPCPLALGCGPGVGFGVSVQAVPGMGFDPAVQAGVSAETAGTCTGGAPEAWALEQAAMVVDVESQETSKVRRNVRRRLTRKRPPPAQMGASAHATSETQAQALANNGEVAAARDEAPASLRSPRNACDAEWQERLEKRQRAVMIIKASEDYKASKQRPETAPEPLTPNASDRTMSKRQWEAAVMKWRKVLRPFDEPQSEIVE